MTYSHVYPYSFVPARPLRADFEPSSLLSDILRFSGSLPSQEKSSRWLTTTPASQPNAALKSYKPKVDLIESEKLYILRLELAGIDPDSVSITLDQSILSVSVERPETELLEGQIQVRSEIQAYLYSREFELPEDAAPTDIKASSKNGILELRISRKVPAPPKMIKVKQH